MNRLVSETDRTADWAEAVAARVTRRCEQLGFESCFIASSGETEGRSEAADPSLVEALLAGDPGEPLSGKDGIAGVRIALAVRGEELGSVLAFAKAGEGGTGMDRLRGALTGLVWSAEDAADIIEQNADIEDLADQMADAYETLELMYALGRSMAGLDNPERFINEACGRVREALGFGFVAVHIPEGAEVGPELAGQTHWSGECTDATEREQLDRVVQLMARVGEHLDAFNGPQAVVRPLRNDAGLVGIIVAGDKTREAGNVSSYDTKLIDAVGGLMSTFLTNTRLYGEQREMALGVLESLSAAIDAKDPYTRGHGQRVAHLSEQIALAMGFEPSKAERLRVAGLLHDVGKIGVSEAVLCKAGRLTDDEYEQIKKHPEIGYRILKDLKGLEDILPAVLHHHERPDGRGYPAGLRADDIPLSARIVAAADTFDAMSSTRSYRAKMPRATVLEELRRSAGSQLDPAVVEALMSIDFTEFDSLIAKHAGGSAPKSRAA